MAGRGASTARETALRSLPVEPVALLAGPTYPCDRPVPQAGFARAMWAVLEERLREAAAGLGAVLAPFADLPPTLAEGADAALPDPPPDLWRRPGPWDLLGDPHRPTVSDAALFACHVLYRLTAFDEARTWVARVRRDRLVSPDEIYPDLIHAAVLVCEGRLREGRLYLEDLLRTHPSLPPGRRAHLLHNLGITCSQLGDFRHGRDLMSQAGALCRQAGLDWQLGGWLIGRGLVEVRNFRLTEGDALLREAIARLEATGQHRFALAARFNLAIALYKQGRVAEALDLVDRIERPLRDAGRILIWLQTRLVRCKTHLVAGRPDTAEPIAVAVEQECRARGLEREGGLAVEMQGDAALLRGEPERARSLYARALTMARRRSPGGDLVAGLRRRLGEVDLRVGETASAQRVLREALLASRSAGEVFEEVVSGRLLAEAELELGEPGRARAVARRSVARAREHGCELELARVLLVEARTAAALVSDEGATGDHRETAWALAAEARRLFVHLGFEADREACDAFLSSLREAWRTAWIWAGGPPPPESLADDATPAFVAGSPPMIACAEIMAAAAASNDAVLITGETGTGKEVAARRIHDLGRRRQGPLVAVNCAALPADLFEREMFGHAAGAFTGADSDARGLVEQAHRGTLFLDEVGDLPLGLQPRLLRLLQEGTFRRLGDPVERQVDLRVIAATNIDLPARVSAGEFRRDLFFRLCVLELGLPPLRDRGSDVLDLVRAFVRLGAGGDAGPEDVLPSFVLAALDRYDWPGNVRELEAVVRRACLFARTGQTLSVGMLPVGLRGVAREAEAVAATEADPADGAAGEVPPGGHRAGGELVAPAQSGLRLEARLAVAEREAIADALAAAEGNRTRAAAMLGISRRALYAKLRRLEMG